MNLFYSMPIRIIFKNVFLYSASVSTFCLCEHSQHFVIQRFLSPQASLTLTLYMYGSRCNTMTCLSQSPLLY